MAQSTSTQTSTSLALVFFVALDAVLVALNSFNAYTLVSVSKKSAPHNSETDCSINGPTCFPYLFAYSLTAGGGAALHAAVGIVSLFAAGKPLTMYKWTHFGLAVVLVIIGLCLAIEITELGRSFYMRFGGRNTVYFQILYYGSFSQSIYGVSGAVLTAIAFAKSAFS